MVFRINHLLLILTKDPPICMRWKAMIAFSFQSPEDQSRWEWMEEPQQCCIGLLMPFCLCRAWQIGWGILGDIILAFFITMTKGPHTHMSLQEARRVEARFNGRYIGSLSGSSLLKGNNKVLTDWEFIQRKKTCWDSLSHR